MMILYYIQIILLISGLKLIKLYSMSPCLSGPCIHGVCVDVEENLYYKCYCINGYTGLNCQTNYDDCRSMPCQHGATCIDGIASFTCSCAEGYTGQLCEDNINECLSNPCQNEGICHDLVNGYKCECLSGYKGEHCEDDINMCNITSSTVTPCLNGGTCIDGPGDKYTCSCPVGFVGARCENDVDECKSSPCKNNGVCIDKPSKFSCICPFGWTGKFCETEVRECEENYCENEAICLVKIFTDGINITDPTCYCVPDYHGLFCEHRYNECLPMTPCMNGGVCVDGIDSFTCTCLRGYTGAICETSCTSEICDLSTQRYTLSMLYDTTQMISTVPTLTIMPETSSYGSFTYVSFQPSDVLTFITDIVASFISSPSLSLDCPSSVTFSESIVWTPFQTIFDISSVYMPVSKSEATDTVLITGHSFSDIQTYSLQTGTHFATSSVLVSSSMESSIQHGSDFEDGTTSVTTSRFTEYTETEVSEISTLETVLYSSILDIPLPTIASYSLYPSTDFFSSFLSDVSFDTSSMHAVITLSDIEAIESTQVTIDTDFPIVTLPTSLDSILQPTPTISFSDESHMFSSETVLPDISKLDMTSFSIETCYGCTDVLTPSYDSIATSDICDNCFTSYVPSYPSSVIDDLHTFSFKYTSLLTETASDISDVAPSAIDSSVIEITTPTPTAVQNLTGLPPLCEDLECENGGIPTRSFDSNETICECLCPLHTMGLRCEEETTVNVPQFLGKSFLKYSLPETIPQYGLNIDFTFRTVLPKGLLFYTELSEEKIFLLLYIHNGMLKLNFSCGQQIMVFSESSLRVDFGFYTAVSLNLWITKDVKNGSCTAALHVNDSAAMSGQQLLMYPKIHFKHLYLGGLPINYVASQSNAHMIEFFVGCIKNLQVNEEEMKMINDALTGAAIIECDSGMCAFQPCWNEGKCISNGENWYCVCKTGYTGVLCEHMNCDANPCEHGGTCLPITNIKYICLCPFEYHSINCEKSLTISRPSFHGDVLEYSSFIQYSNKIDIQHHLYIKLKFTTSDFLQYGLLVFTGQQDVKDPMADYLALTLEKGFITYYINLGSGYRWIQSPTSLNISLLVHTVYFGHHKRYIWLVVDNQKKVTGVTPGKLTALNTVPHIFVGGHVSYNFTLLPFPIAQLTGFKGCIFDIEISNSPQNSFLTLNNIVSGRNVQQCNKTECELTLCENGGTCVDFGTTFECLCNAGWAGPTCSLKITPCSVGTHHCAPKSTCMVLTDGYRCDCALGQSGIYCNETSIPSDPQFNGRNSFMEFKQQNIRRKTDIKIQLKPKSDNGLLFYATQQMNENTGDFIALTIVNGYVNLRYNLGTGLGTTTILQNPQRVTINKWHTVVVKRYEQVAYLIVDNNEVSVKSPPVMIALDTMSNFFVGGLPDLTVISKEAVAIVPTTYSGCISYFEVNNKKYVLSAEAIHGRNIDGCDGASCGLHSCKNGGTCIDLSNGTFSCNCLPGYVGLQCDIPSLCFNHQCQNGGTCIPTTTSVIYSCDCPVGWTGLTCEKALNVSVAKFGENSYIYFWDKHYQFGDLSETNLAFNFSSINESGLLLWSGKDSRNDDYLGIGLQNGQLKIVWNLGWLFHHRILTEENYFGDSNWHSFSFKRYKQEVIVAIDDKKYTSKSTGDYYELNTNGQYYFGGFPRFMKTKEITNGHFTVPLNGCIGNIVLPYTWDFTDIMNAHSSANIENCESNYVSL